MAKCNLVDSCFFFNDQLGDMPHASEYLKDKFCKCDFVTVIPNYIVRIMRLMTCSPMICLCTCSRTYPRYANLSEK